MLFDSGESVRFTPRSCEAVPMDAVIGSKPVGIRDVPAMGLYYFIIAPTYRGFVSADRLSRKSASITKMLQTFARRAEFGES